jgi:hypothetical protein
MLQSRYSRALVILVAALLLSSCKKEQTTFYIPDEFKAWSCYKTGSYWVYLNDKTGAQDCTWVSKDTNYMQQGYRDDDQDPVEYYEKFESTVSGDLYSSYYTMASGNGSATVPLLPDYLESISYSMTTIQTPSFSRRIYRNTMYNYGVANVYPEETVNGNQFSNVYDIRHEWFSGRTGSYGDSLIAGIHLVKNVGIVKLRKYNEGADTTWSLLRWKVIQ